jgi:hypothetical protein
MDCTASIDFLVVPTITFKLLFVLIVLSHERRRAVHFGITANPTAEWTARQMTEAFPWDTAPRFLIRDRHRTYGRTFRDHVAAMAITEVPTAPRSPWQNGHVERVIGSVRRECLDHVIALNDRQLKRVLKSYLAYYNQTRTHLALDKDAPKPRSPANTNDGPIVTATNAWSHSRGRRASYRSVAPGLWCDLPPLFARWSSVDHLYRSAWSNHQVPCLVKSSSPLHHGKLKIKPRSAPWESWQLLESEFSEMTGRHGKEGDHQREPHLLIGEKTAANSAPMWRKRRQRSF